MASLPVEVLLGIYLGLLVGVIPALISWTLGFTFKYVTGITLPGFAVVVLAIALAGVNGGLMALADKSITQSPNAERIVTAILLVAMGALYAHAKGDQMGATFPHRLSLRGLRERTLSSDVIELVGGRGQVRIRVVGEVADMEGYPPLPEEVRAGIRGEAWTFPADLRIGELEERVADRLRTAFDLGDVSVTVDERGRATVIAAPPFSGLSKRVAEGHRAVSVDALLPTGLARGDEVTLLTADGRVRGTVVSARSDGGGARAAEPAPAPDDEREGEEATSAPVRAPTTDGGEGRITVGVDRTEAEHLLGADRATVVVESRGTRREYELVSLLRRADRRFRRLTVRAGGALADATLRATHPRETYGVAVLAVRGEGGWRVAPDGDVAIDAGDEIYAVGTRDALDAFAEAIA
ncbi:MAG: TrkA C-terminal domain-containing protein [Haloarculaceae archaeon]